MALVVERLVELTGLRDREMLDATLVGVVRDLLPTRGAAIFRPVGEGAERRWLASAPPEGMDDERAGDPRWGEFEDLPALDACPARLRCLESGAIVESAGAAGAVVTAFPLLSEGRPLAVLKVESGIPLDEAHRRLVEGVLRIVGNVQGLLDYGERDTLTGLLNRKTFDESFMRIAFDTQPREGGVDQDRRAEPAAPRRPMLGVIDIDHFKRINDHHGHLIGDEVLLLLGRLMQSTFRHHDRLFRFGGEEFVVLMHAIDESGALAAFERLRSSVERYEFPRVGHITISVGVSEVRPHDTPSACFGRADRAVYYAKANGRNRVASFAALVAEGRLDDEEAAGDAAGVELF